VQHHGIGIHLSQNKSTIFERGKTLGDAPHNKGLELFHIKNQVEGLNGSLSIESELGTGTAVTITLPHSCS